LNLAAVLPASTRLWPRVYESTTWFSREPALNADPCDGRMPLIRDVRWRSARPCPLL